MNIGSDCVQTVGAVVQGEQLLRDRKDDATPGTISWQEGERISVICAKQLRDYLVIHSYQLCFLKADDVCVGLHNNTAASRVIQATHVPIQNAVVVAVHGNKRSSE